MSINQSMGISIDSMKNNQYALAVVSHNIANLNTEGYARQRVDFVEVRTPNSSKNVYSVIKSLQGADISSLTNSIDKAAFDGMINSNSDANYYNTLADSLGELEDVADDLGDNGLNALLNDFYKACANLEQFPADMSIRQQYVLALENVCDKFNSVAKKCDNIQQDKYDTVKGSLNNINSLLSDLASLNEAYIKNGNASSTQTQINSILQELSNYTKVTYDQNSNGSYNVYFGNVAVVQGTEQKFNLEANLDPESEEVLSFSLRSVDDTDFVLTEGINDFFKTGSLKAQIDFLNGSGGSFSNLNDIKNYINEASSAFKTALNNLQTQTDEDGFPAYIVSENGELLLSNDPEPVDLLTGDSAKDLKVNESVIKNPFLVCAARINLDNYTEEEIANDAWRKSIGNADNAGKMTNLQNQKICYYNLEDKEAGNPPDCTLGQFLINNAAKAGMDVAGAQNKADIYQGIADSDADNYSNMVGVNLDEELADMIKYQRAFEASARVFATINDLMGTIINMV